MCIVPSGVSNFRLCYMLIQHLFYDVHMCNSYTAGCIMSSKVNKVKYVMLQLAKGKQ